MKNIHNSKIIELLQDKHDSFLGTEGQKARDDFKSGLSWAIDTLSTLTKQKDSEARDVAIVRVMATESLSPQKYEQFGKLLNELCATRHISNEALAKFYVELSGKKNHASDCVTSQATAYIPAPCDCDTQ